MRSRFTFSVAKCTYRNPGTTNLAQLLNRAKLCQLAIERYTIGGNFFQCLLGFTSQLFPLRRLVLTERGSQLCFLKTFAPGVLLARNFHETRG
jgi:hypothetical protein